MRVLITTIPFSDKEKRPLELLDKVGAEVVINPLGRKVKEADVVELISAVDVLNAGTESIT